MFKELSFKGFLIEEKFIILLPFDGPKMNLEKHIKEAHKKGSRSHRKDLVACWKEKEPLEKEKEPVEAFSVIFRTRGCYWAYASGCSMCGYHTDTNPNIDKKDLEDQLQEALSEYDGEKIVKIYTSGSFLDEKELEQSMAVDILESFEAEKTVIESRPGFIDLKKVKHYSKKVDGLEVAIGLESADDFVLKNCINKGFTFDNYDKKVRLISELVSIRTYLLLNPPFLLEREAIEDVKKSVEKIKDLTDVVSINPVNVQSGSLVEKLWWRKNYRPPWLWSIIEVLKDMDDPIVFISKAGMGSKRGAHNCGECDDLIKDMIHNFNLTQDRSLLSSVPDCRCKKRWSLENEIEPSLFFRGTPKLLSDRYTGYL